MKVYVVTHLNTGAVYGVFASQESAIKHCEDNYNTTEKGFRRGLTFLYGSEPMSNYLISERDLQS